MKTHYYYLILWFIAVMPLCFTACSDDNEPEPEPRIWPYLKINQKDFELKADVQELNVPAQTNMNEVRVEISLDCDWLTYKEMVIKSGTNDVEFVFKVNANVSESERVGYIMFASPLGEEKSAIIPETIKVTQSAP